jgi:hypothetical protein
LGDVECAAQFARGYYSLAIGVSLAHTRIMGAGASVLRLRKALVIRSYNLRAPDETVEEQFKRFAYRDDGVLKIKLEDVKSALGMDTESGEYLWVGELFRHTFGAHSEVPFLDFIHFLENGKPVRTHIYTHIHTHRSLLPHAYF